MKKFLLMGSLLAILTLATFGSAWADVSKAPTIPTIPEAPGTEVVVPNMWLLTRGEPGDWPPCMILSPLYPAPERQSALCFNDSEWTGFYDPDWVADRSPCHGPIYSNDHWVCDSVMREWGGARKSLQELRETFGEHLNTLPVDLWKYYTD